MFASQILLPLNSVNYVVHEYFSKESIFKPHLILDNQHCNQVLVFTLLNEIHHLFGVSKEAAKFRLIKMGLLIDTTDNSISNLLRENPIENYKGLYQNII